MLTKNVLQVSLIMKKTIQLIPGGSYLRHAPSASLLIQKVSTQ